MYYLPTATLKSMIRSGLSKPAIDLDIAVDGTLHPVSLPVDTETNISGTVSITPTNTTFRELSFYFTGLSGDEVINVQWPAGTDNLINLFEPSTTVIDSGSSEIPNIQVSIGTIASTNLTVVIEVVD